jgi:hypothetical protein
VKGAKDPINGTVRRNHVLEILRDQGGMTLRELVVNYERRFGNFSQPTFHALRGHLTVLLASKSIERLDAKFQPSMFCIAKTATREPRPLNLDDLLCRAELGGITQPEVVEALIRRIYELRAVAFDLLIDASRTTQASRIESLRAVIIKAVIV